ncbi:MAG TPA: hypothetical protein DCX07_12050, partial [Phycisphaerales bacterium]|nr:hypothetical protein [Phycisphaerales bacterium]
MIVMKTWISSWRQVMWALALAVVLARGAAAQSRPAETPTFQQRAAAKIAEFESAHKAVAGVSVVDVRTGKPLVAFRANELRSPASNQKLLTSAFALARLGGDFRFVTRVYLAGQDVVVLGDYDPTTGDPVLAEQAQKTVYDEPDRWAQAVKAQTQGVRNVYVIVRRDHEAFRHPDWPGGQHDKWYAAPVASLNFNNNCFDVTWAVETGAAVPTLTPSAAGIRVDNQVRVGPRHVWRLTTNADDSVVTLTGTIARGSSDPLSAAVNDPPLLLGRVLADRIARAGVTVAGGAVAIDRERVVIKPEAQPLCQTVTPLADAMARANKRSLNMAAECLFLRAGDGTWAGSAKLMSETLAKEFA